MRLVSTALAILSLAGCGDSPAVSGLRYETLCGVTIEAAEIAIAAESSSEIHEFQRLRDSGQIFTVQYMDRPKLYTQTQRWTEVQLSDGIRSGKTCWLPSQAFVP